VALCFVFGTNTAAVGSASARGEIWSAAGRFEKLWGDLTCHAHKQTGEDSSRLSAFQSLASGEWCWCTSRT